MIYIKLSKFKIRRRSRRYAVFLSRYLPFFHHISPYLTDFSMKIGQTWYNNVIWYLDWYQIVKIQKFAAVAGATPFFEAAICLF